MTSLHDSSQEKVHDDPCDAAASPGDIDVQRRGARSDNSRLARQDRSVTAHARLLAEQLWAYLRAAAAKSATLDTVRTRAKLSEPAGLCACAAVAAALIATLLVYAVYVKPLDNALAREQAANLAREMDAAIKARSTAVSMAINTLERSQGVASAELERLAAAFARAFPDFLSLEIANDQGEILALIGDVPLAEAARPMGSETSEGRSMPSADMFGMDTAQQSFFVAGEAEAPEGGKWFGRARFSRASIDKVLASSTAGRTATLIEVPDKSQSARSGAAGTLSIVRELWGGPIAAESCLSVPGWGLRLERPAGISLLACLGVITLVSIGLAATGLFLIPPTATWLDPKRVASEEGEPEAVVEIMSSDSGPTLGNEAEPKSEPAFTREIEVPTHALPEPTGAVVLDFSDLEDAGPSTEPAASRQIPYSEADETRTANIPESLEFTWDEQRNADYSASSRCGSRPTKFVAP